MSIYFKLLSLVFFAITNCIPVLAQKTEVEQASKLQKVIVFTDRAMITREATFSVKKGENSIRISGLTPNLVDQSVQINLIGQTDINISEVNVEETFLNKTEQPELQKLLTTLNNLNNQIKEETNQLGVINSSNDFLKRVNPFPQNQKVTTADIEAHARFIEKSLSANYDRMSSIESKLKKQNEEKALLEKEIAELNPGKNKSKSIVIHLLSASDKSGVKVSFSYISPEAGWSSQYEARAVYATSAIDFNYFASIWQSTGEDWLGANIEISTARPFVYGNTPELSAWYLDVYTPRPYMMKSQRVLEEVSDSRAMISESAPPPPPPPAEIVEENTSFSFVLPRKVDVISDGQPHRVAIATSNTAASLSYFTIPKLVQNAFLKATIKNPFQFPLLPGSIVVFFDQKLVGNASVNEAILPDGKLEISLGIDEGIKIERKLQKKFTDYAGLFSKETKVYYEYAIELTNGKSKEVTLDLNDQFPVSRNEKIKVEVDAPKGGDATVNEEGIISWKVTLAPGAKKSIPVKFNISYPKELTINGLQ